MSGVKSGAGRLVCIPGRALFRPRRLPRLPELTAAWAGRRAAADPSGQKRGPVLLSKNRAMTWQRPTLAGPNVQLPLAAEGLTAVFGMGTGGTPRL